MKTTYSVVTELPRLVIQFDESAENPYNLGTISKLYIRGGTLQESYREKRGDSIIYRICNKV